MTSFSRDVTRFIVCKLCVCVSVSTCVCVHECGCCLHLCRCKYANRFFSTRWRLFHSNWNVLKICKIVVHFYIPSNGVPFFSVSPFHLDNCPGARIAAHRIQTGLFSPQRLRLIWLHQIFPNASISHRSSCLLFAFRFALPLDSSLSAIFRFGFSVYCRKLLPGS